MDTESIKKCKWEKYWSDTRSILFAWYLGNYYTHMMAQYFGLGFSKAAIIARGGYSACYFDVDDRRIIGSYLVEKVIQDPLWLKEYCKVIQQKANFLSRFCAKTKSKIDMATIDHFLELLYRYVAWHISPRHIIDYLPTENVKECLPLLQHVRLYTEPVYKEVDNFLKRWSYEVFAATEIPSELVLCCTGEEVMGYFKNGNLPERDKLEKRYEGFAMLFFSNFETTLYVEQYTDMVESALVSVKGESVIGGTVAFPGKVSGRVRLIHDPRKVSNFDVSDILVTGMTRPDFLPFMKKAGAMITDSGGVLCHAAITARELKIPCIIGTQVATKIFKDGDVVEVDAEKGIVRKLS